MVVAEALAVVVLEAVDMARFSLKLGVKGLELFRSCHPNEGCARDGIYERKELKVKEKKTK